MFRNYVIPISIVLTCSQFDVPLLTVVDTITMDNTYCAHKKRETRMDPEENETKRMHRNQARARAGKRPHKNHQQSRYRRHHDETDVATPQATDLQKGKKLNVNFADRKLEFATITTSDKTHTDMGRQRNSNGTTVRQSCVHAQP